MRPPRKGRRRSIRLRVYYQEGNRLRPGDLLFDGEQPILVIHWRTIARRCVPGLTSGFLHGGNRRRWNNALAREEVYTPRMDHWLLRVCVCRRPELAFSST